jgi:hypothetical protein
MLKILKGFYLLLLLLAGTSVYAGTLSCTVTTSCPTGTVIYRLSDTDNAHAELSSQANYAQLVCCTGVSSLGNSCAGTYATPLNLSAVTNAHVEENDQGNYGSSACISVPSGGTVSVGYRVNNCNSYDTTLGSISAATNAHVGDGSAYTTKVCASATGVTQSLTFSISDNSIGFGTVDSSNARYATGDLSGAAADSSDAHTITAATNATSGYVIALNGSTLTCSSCGGATISEIGGTAAASSVGSEQFGMRVAVNSGTGTASSPYNGATWALDTASFPDEIASGSGDNASTIYGVRYLTNISPTTETGSYSATLTYTITANF